MAKAESEGVDETVTQAEDVDEISGEQEGDASPERPSNGVAATADAGHDPPEDGQPEDDQPEDDQPQERAGPSHSPKPGADDPRDEHTTLRRRIAAGIRDSSPLGRLRDFIFPLLVLCVLVFLLLSFRTVLLPFIFACILVYLMEPIVRRLGGAPGREGYVPRWVAVIFVYLIFIGSVGVFSVLVVPRFVTEIIRFAETVPEVVSDFRENQLPGIDADVQEFIRSYVPAKQGMPDNVLAREAVRSARRSAAQQATAFAAAQASIEHAAEVDFVWEVRPQGPTSPNGADDPAEEGRESGATAVSGSYRVVPPGPPPKRLSLDEALATSSGWNYNASQRSSIRLEPTEKGGVEVFLQGMAIEVEQTEDHVWTVRESREDQLPVRDGSLEIEERFNLQRTLDEIIGNLVTTSNARISSVIDVAQKLVVGVVGGFVAIILTLMVAAFISIDLPRVMSFLRGFVPERGRSGYDVLLSRMDRGLAGVVRGQLLICLVNGVFTYIGLVIIGVKFAVLLGVVAGVLSLIPVFGTVISTIPIVLIGLTDGFMTGVLALGWILLIHFVEANILNPKIIGSSAHIHPVIVIFALLAGESAYGLVGALLAVPTASILLTMFEFVRTRAWREGDSDAEAETA